MNKRGLIKKSFVWVLLVIAFLGLFIISNYLSAAKSDQYYKAGKTYLEARDIRDAIKSLTQSISDGKEALEKVEDEATRAQIDAEIKRRELELKKLKAGSHAQW